MLELELEIITHFRVVCGSHFFFFFTDEQCPSLHVEEWKFPQTARHNITGEKTSFSEQTDTFLFCDASANAQYLLTGFNLVRRFSLLKSADVKKIRNPRGPIILRLGKTALLRPTE